MARAYLRDLGTLANRRLALRKIMQVVRRHLLLPVDLSVVRRREPETPLSRVVPGHRRPRVGSR